MMTVAEAVRDSVPSTVPGAERWTFVTEGGRHIHATLNWSLVEQLQLERPNITRIFQLGGPSK